MDQQSKYKLSQGKIYLPAAIRKILALKENDLVEYKVEQRGKDFIVFIKKHTEFRGTRVQYPDKKSEVTDV